MTQHLNMSAAALLFGPFRLIPSRRALLRDGRPVRLPSRAGEILKILTRRPGVLVSKRELMQQVWLGLVVEEGTLRVHMATLRKILGDGKDDMHYVETVTGFGYRFAAPVIAVADAPYSLAWPATPRTIQEQAS